MTTDYAAVQQQIQSAVHLLTDLQTRLAPSAMNAGLAALEELSAQLEQASGGQASPDAQRAALAQCQQRLRDLSDWLDRKKTEVAEAYRQSLGAEKDTFEAMQAQEQEQLHPIPYRIRQSFGLVSAAGDVLVSIGSGLQDLSGSIERQTLNTLEQSAQVESPASLQTGFDSDTDPAPSPYSP
ncbi:hypothetical protein J31TS4_47060 [Paenibacillus sp. J31TS4]|uniref:hypothetical protein n=1 Tax=Paenibacillus sp. J31TS4 TaxID=2807195 RepID=UPI001B12891D|nr:hypothetical protein [Paenibacillus sp. J31TS4]GIP41426.1 hypothetical protein J31TS4_47060 [Paenibacillus sp. J31TS4]